MKKQSYIEIFACKSAFILITYSRRSTWINSTIAANEQVSWWHIYRVGQKNCAVYMYFHIATNLSTLSQFSLFLAHTLQEICNWTITRFV